MTDFEQGTCKWFNVAKGWGFITSEDGTKDVFVHQSVIQMSGFRSLGDNEKVEFKATKTDKGLEATVVRSTGGGDCQGSHRRPGGAKQKSKKVRCYNCGEFASHYASQCDKGPLPKRCHNCKSEGHLIENCPTLPDEKKRPLREAMNNNKNNNINGVKVEDNPDKAAAATNGVKKEAQQEEKPELVAQVKEEAQQTSTVTTNNNNNNNVKGNNNINNNNNNKKRNNNNNNPKVQAGKEKAAK